MIPTLSALIALAVIAWAWAALRAAEQAWRAHEDEPRPTEGGKTGKDRP